MDWELIKRHAYQLDAVLKKQKQPGEVDPEIGHMMLVWCYCDARWLADLPAEERKEGLEKVHELFRDDVKDMAKLILKGEIP
jgi:hypothetical protein